MLGDKTIDKSTPIPLYFQLESMILEEIKSGTYAPGDLIPTEVELSDMFQISRTTVRQAITDLVNNGYVYRVKSKGTFVSPPKIERMIPAAGQPYSAYTFEQEMYEKGHTPDSKVVDLKEVEAPSVMIKNGYNSPSGKAIYVYRIRYVDGKPLERVISYLHYEHFREYLETDELSHFNIGQIMNRKEETKVHRVSRILEVLPASSEDVKIFDIKSKSPVQLMTSLRYDVNDDLLDISYAYYRGDMSRLHFEVSY